MAPRRGARALAGLALVALLTVSTLPPPASAATSLPAYYIDALVIGGISSARGLAFLPGGKIILTENAGAIRLYENGTLRTLYSVPTVNTGSERGLLGIDVDPDFPTRPYIYVHYTAAVPATYVQIARFTVTNASGGGPLGIDGSSRLLYLADMPDSAFNHNGGTVRFGPDKRLYISIGDDADNCAAQDLTQMKGKILRINVNDSAEPANRASLAPPDNPFASNPNVNATLVWAYGLRNPFRFDIDPPTGRLVIGDVGQNSWEEVDISTGGENFGWPYYEGNHTYRTTLCPTDSAIPSWTRPIYEYPNPGGASVVGTPFYRQAGYPNDSSLPLPFEGAVFFTDFYSGNLRVLRQNGSSWDLIAGFSATNFGTGFYGAPDMRVGPEGDLYYLSASTGELRRVYYQSQPRILTDTVPPGSVGDSYRETLDAEGNSRPFSWSVVFGALPAGLSLGPSNGTIYGTPTAGGSFGFTVQAQSTAGRTGTKAFSLPVAEPLSMVMSSLPIGYQDVPYNAMLSASGGDPPYSWQISSGMLPSGITLDPDAGALSGTPTTFGSFDFTCQVTDLAKRTALQTLTLEIVERVRITTTSLPSGEQGLPYTARLTATAGLAPYTWNLISGTLPAGIAFDGVAGELSGTPSAPGVEGITFRATDGNGLTDSRLLDIAIAPPPGGPPVIGVTQLPPGLEEHAYDAIVPVVGGIPPLTWQMTAGSLPDGLEFDSVSGRIFGNAAGPVNATFTVSVTDSRGQTDSRVFTLEIRPLVRSLRFLDLSLPGGEIGAPYGPVALRIEALNTTGTLVWSAVGLAPGIVLSDAGVLSGNPTVNGHFEPTVSVRDQRSPPINASQTFSTFITRIYIKSTALGNTTVGIPVSFDLEIDGTTRSVTWELESGSLPPGLELDPAGEVAGVATTPGNYTFVLRAAVADNPANFATREYHMQIYPRSYPDAGTLPPPPAADTFPWPLAMAMAVGAGGAVVIVWRTLRRRQAEP